MARLRPVTSSFTLFLSLLHLVLATASESSLTLTMDTTGMKAETYYCASVRVSQLTRYIIKYEPNFNAVHEHHVLVFGCKEHRDDDRWLCPHTGDICEFSSAKILYAWAKQAEGLALPKDVGFQVGRAAKVQSIVMQVHVKVPPLPLGPPPSLTFTITTAPQKYAVGIFLVGSGVYSIAPKKSQIKLKSACYYQGPTMHPFAFRTHAHSHGVVISGYVVKNNKWDLIGQRSPQDPQAFYPATDGLTVRTGDMLAAACTFDTSNEHHEINFGPTSKDEMCNFYIMYYYKADTNIKISPSDTSCWMSAPASLRYPLSAFYLPNAAQNDTNSTEVQPTTQTEINTNATTGTEAHTTATTGTETNTTVTTGTETNSSATTGTEAHTTAVLTETQPTTQTMQTEAPTQAPTTHPPPPPADPISMSAIFAPAEDWPSTSASGTGASVLGGVTLGQVSGVAVDTEGNVFVLHRASRVWDATSFSLDNRYQFIKDGAIADPVVLKVSPKGSLLKTWGRRIFYMPHGLTIDSRNNLWITDTARHQVMRAPVFNTNKKDPPLVLGTPFIPGIKRNQFCKPAAVAVDEHNDIFYVADGYCNSRIMVFRSDGSYLTQYSSPVGGVIMHIPHSLALSQGGTHLFVADRLNNRILQFDTTTKRGEVFCRVEGSMFAISLARTRDGQRTWPLYAVNGSSFVEKRAVGFSINSTGNIVATWSPPKGFTKPHDLSASSDSSVYVAEIGPNLVWKMIPVPSGGNAVLPDVPDTTPSHDETSAPSQSSPDTPPSSQPPSSSEEGDTEDYVCPTPPPPPSLGLNCTTRTISSSSSDFTTTSRHSLPITLFTSSIHPLLTTIAMSSSDSSSTTDPSSCQTSCVVYITNTAASSRLTVSPLQVIFVSSMVVPVLLALVIFIGCYLYHHRYRGRKEVPQRATRIALDTILGPARKGFHPVRNYDSDSGEEEDMFIFSKS